MADITVTCSQCGNNITVSEYVEADFLTCLRCRQKVSLPKDRVEAPQAAAKLKLASPGSATQPAAAPAPSTPAGAPALVDEVRRNTPAMKRLRRRRKPAALSHALVSGGIFTLMAGGLLYLRFYPDAMPGGQRELLITAAIAALGVLHVSVIAYAFADEAFHGVMCTIIPGYSLYYLYVHADQMLLRAVVGALLIAFGVDTVQAIQKFAHEFYVSTSAWIRDTDTYKKDRVPTFK